MYSLVCGTMMIRSEISLNPVQLDPGLSPRTQKWSSRRV